MPPRKTGITPKRGPKFRAKKTYSGRHSTARKRLGKAPVLSPSKARSRSRRGLRYPQPVVKTTKKISRVSPPPRLCGNEKSPQGSFPLYRDGEYLGDCEIMRSRRIPIGTGNYIHLVAIDGKPICHARLHHGRMRWDRRA